MSFNNINVMSFHFFGHWWTKRGWKEGAKKDKKWRKKKKNLIENYVYAPLPLPEEPEEPEVPDPAGVLYLFVF
tara:strand:- start:313 stop:531 length:219 start_codon:yes stop_codon:yes gene_type:complete